MTKILGLDLGITSVGYAVVELDENNFENGDILTSGVRIFDVAEDPQKGSPLSAPRRQARALRRILRRKTVRLQQLRDLFIKHHILSAQEVASLYQGSVPNVYQIRAEALQRKQDLQDMCRALLHIAKRRGFRSLRKSAEEKDKETGELLKGISQLKTLLSQSNCQTIGDFLYKLPQAEPKRNKAGSYSHSIARSMLEKKFVFYWKSNAILEIPFLRRSLSKNFTPSHLTNAHYVHLNRAPAHLNLTNSVRLKMRIRPNCLLRSVKSTTSA